jgi:hypothetical protein
VKGKSWRVRVDKSSPYSARFGDQIGLVVIRGPKSSDVRFGRVMVNLPNASLVTFREDAMPRKSKRKGSSPLRSKRAAERTSRSAKKAAKGMKVPRTANERGRGNRIDQRLIELGRRDAAGFTRLAKRLLDADRLDEAERAYRRALEVDPTNRIARGGIKRMDARRRGADLGDSDDQLTAKQRVSWTILPDGELPWPRLEAALGPVLRSAGYRHREEDAARLKFLADLNPSFTAVGREGFNGYVLFGFEDKGIYVLESPLYGNATYVLDGDWKTLSRKSKAELLRSHFHRDRIIHTKSWPQRLRSWV